jgi:hypothetical protein
LQTTATKQTEAAIWSRVIRPDRKDLAMETARAILKLEFAERDRLRMRELAAKAREGALTLAEQEEVANYERVGSFLSLLKAKARRTLREQ